MYKNFINEDFSFETETQVPIGSPIYIGNNIKRINNSWSTIAEIYPNGHTEIFLDNKIEGEAIFIVISTSKNKNGNYINSVVAASKIEELSNEIERKIDSIFTE